MDNIGRVLPDATQSDAAYPQRERKTNSIRERKPTMQYLNPKNRRRGQGMTEYVIIVALLAITSIGMINIFGRSIKYQMGKVLSLIHI